jgi:hypothetical protein
MPVMPVSEDMLQFVDDEMLRAPLLFDQLVEGTSDRVKKGMAGLTPVQRSSAAEMLHSLQGRRSVMADLFLQSLRQQVQAELQGLPSPATAKPSIRDARAQTLALVDEDEVALDVELAHAIEGIRSVAEYELRELLTYVAAIRGDMDVTRDHNPFRAETYARATWAAAQGLAMGRGHQVAFMRHASQPLAALLRQAYAASCSRLESQGVVPAAYRTVILPSGARRSRAVDTTFSPDLRQLHDTLPAPLAPVSAPRAAPPRPQPEPSALPPRVDPRTQALVDRLFAAIRTDTRVPPDVLQLIMRLHNPALRLAQIEGEAMADEDHPLWRFVNCLAYEAEMMPDGHDPERVQLLRVALATVTRLAGEARQSSSLYRWANEALGGYLRQRLERRCTAAASQIGALQKLEDRLVAGQPIPSTMNGALDLPQLDTVPAELLPEHLPQVPAAATLRWLDDLQPGAWLRLFLQGRWVHAQVLWPGERREVWLLGDGASDVTWAVRRRALAILYEARLLKGLTRRSLVRRAANQVQEEAQSHAA